jgi:ribosomal protein L12E/L44/L45/RPP1/RPP2
MTHRSILSAAALALASLSAAAVAGPASAPHAAACVAALKAQEAGLAETVKAGEPLEAVLLKVVRSGIAIIGTQYLAGLREVEARALLEAAERDFQALPAAAAEQRQAACLQEGEALYAHASPLERSLITTAAQRRIRRLTAST